jgi:hypothetical protein
MIWVNQMHRHADVVFFLVKYPGSGMYPINKGNHKLLEHKIHELILNNCDSFLNRRMESPAFPWLF